MILLQILLICSVQVKSEVSTIPRYFTESTCSRAQFGVITRGVAIDVRALREISMKKRLDSFSFRCFSTSMKVTIAVMTICSIG